MATTTTNLGLTKPALNEVVDVSVLNTNADIIDEALAGCREATITTSWTGALAPYTQDISVAGITSDDKPIIGVVYSTDNATAILQKEAWNLVGKITTGDNKITVTCFEEKPVTAIPIQIKGV